MSTSAETQSKWAKTWFQTSRCSTPHSTLSLYKCGWSQAQIWKCCVGSLAISVTAKNERNNFSGCESMIGGYSLTLSGGCFALTEIPKSMSQTLCISSLSLVLDRCRKASLSAAQRFFKEYVVIVVTGWHDLSHDLRHEGLQHATPIAGGIQLVNVPAIASAMSIHNMSILKTSQNISKPSKPLSFLQYSSTITSSCTPPLQGLLYPIRSNIRCRKSHIRAVKPYDFCQAETSKQQLRSSKLSNSRMICGCTPQVTRAFVEKSQQTRRQSSKVNSGAYQSYSLCRLRDSGPSVHFWTSTSLSG